MLNLQNFYHYPRSDKSGIMMITKSHFMNCAILRQKNKYLISIVIFIMNKSFRLFYILSRIIVTKTFLLLHFHIFSIQID